MYLNSYLLFQGSIENHSEIYYVQVYHIPEESNESHRKPQFLYKEIIDALSPDPFKQKLVSVLVLGGRLMRFMVLSIFKQYLIFSILK